MLNLSPLTKRPVPKYSPNGNKPHPPPQEQIHAVARVEMIVAVLRAYSYHCAFLPMYSVLTCSWQFVLTHTVYSSLIHFLPKQKCRQNTVTAAQLPPKNQMSAPRTSSISHHAVAPRRLSRPSRALSITNRHLTTAQTARRLPGPIIFCLFLVHTLSLPPDTVYYTNSSSGSLTTSHQILVLHPYPPHPATALSSVAWSDPNSPNTQPLQANNKSLNTQPLQANNSSPNTQPMQASNKSSNAPPVQVSNSSPNTIQVLPRIQCFPNFMKAIRPSNNSSPFTILRSITRSPNTILVPRPTYIYPTTKPS